MGNQILADLAAAVTRATTVNASAVAAFGGFAERMRAAVAAAIANGATEEELAPVVEEIDALETSTNELAAAVEENTGAGGGATTEGRGRSK